MYLLSRGRKSGAAEGDLEGADIVAVARADIEQLEDAPTHEHLYQRANENSYFKNKRHPNIYS